MSNRLAVGPISRAFFEKGVYTFEEACLWVQTLPYRRNSDKSDTFIVLKEECGTCSSKHELIKRLSEESELENCALVLCIFKMSGKNTPKVQPVLDKYRLDYIPEAHTYIVLDGIVMDLTFPDNSELNYQKDILNTEEIFADQIRDYKVESHRAYLRKWREENETSYTFAELWRIREECIEALTL